MTYSKQELVEISNMDLYKLNPNIDPLDTKFRIMKIMCALPILRHVTNLDVAHASMVLAIGIILGTHNRSHVDALVEYRNKHIPSCPPADNALRTLIEECNPNPIAALDDIAKDLIEPHYGIKVLHEDRVMITKAHLGLFGSLELVVDKEDVNPLYLNGFQTRSQTIHGINHRSDDSNFITNFYGVSSMGFLGEYKSLLLNDQEPLAVDKIFKYIFAAITSIEQSIGMLEHDNSRSTIGLKLFSSERKLVWDTLSR